MITVTKCHPLNWLQAPLCSKRSAPEVGVGRAKSMNSDWASKPADQARRIRINAQPPASRRARRGQTDVESTICTGASQLEPTTRAV